MADVESVLRAGACQQRLIRSLVAFRTRRESEYSLVWNPLRVPDMPA